MTIKVLIVDDEYLERTLIKLGVNWKENDFKIVGEADSGEEALRIIHKTNPDVIFTDICMPFMDGLGLCEKVRELYPNIKLVIITGHREFEYAQKAVKLGVTEFLLKPINNEEVLKIGLKLKKEIEDQRKIESEIINMKLMLDENFYAAKEKFVGDLIYSRLGLENVYSKLPKFNLEFLLGFVFCLCIKFSFKDNENSYKDWHNRILNLSEKSFSSLVDYASIYTNDEEMVILAGDLEGEELIKRSGEKFIVEIIDEVKCEVAVGISTKHKGVEEIPVAYKEALEAVGGRTTYGNNKAILYSDMNGLRKTCQLVYRAKKYIDENFQNPELSLRSIAQSLYVNDSYLSRLFKQETSESVIEYITKLRIKRSIEYINNTNLKAYEIAERIGISDPHYFGICFKKYTGKSVNEYRKGK